MVFPSLAMMLSLGLIVLLLGGEGGGVHGHALWQQTVYSSPDFDSHHAGGSGHNLTTIFTFAESPGAAQAESPRVGEEALLHGVFAYLQETDNEYDPLLQLTTRPSDNGRFLVAPLPLTSSPYALESYFVSTLQAEDAGENDPPTLTVYYTSAPHDYDDAWDVSAPVNAMADAESDVVYRNKFRVSLERANDDDGVRVVEAYVVFAGRPLASADVKLYDGDTGEKLDTRATDPAGFVLLHLPQELPGTLFAKVKHDVDTPGTRTSDGTPYDVVQYRATTCLDTTSSYADWPANVTVTNLSSSSADSTTTSKILADLGSDLGSDLGRVGIVLIHVFLLLSFVGGVVSVNIVDRMQSFAYFSAPTTDPTLDLSQSDGDLHVI